MIEKAQPAASHVDAARQLFSSIRLTGPELDSHIDRARSIEYWQSLASDLSIESRTSVDLQPACPFDAAEQSRLLTRFREGGHLSLAGILPRPILDRMAAAVLTLESEDWPAVFAYVYDEFWVMPRIPTLVDLFTSILGPEYRQTAYPWVHVVQGRRGAAGWRPHIDHGGPDFRLTVWIPLTDASVESGCMCVLPKDRVPASVAGRFYEKTPVAMADALRLLHAARPLPASPGAVLCWEAGLLHWGLVRQIDGEPRISFSMEFMAAGDPLLPSDTLPATTRDLPTFEERLTIIAKALTTYYGSEPRASRYLDLARRLSGDDHIG